MEFRLGCGVKPRPQLLIINCKTDEEQGRASLDRQERIEPKTHYSNPRISGSPKQANV